MSNPTIAPDDRFGVAHSSTIVADGKHEAGCMCGLCQCRCDQPQRHTAHLGDCLNECRECDWYVDEMRPSVAVATPTPGFVDYMARAHITEQHPDIAVIRNAYVAGWVDCSSASFIATSVATPCEARTDQEKDLV